MKKMFSFIGLYLCLAIITIPAVHADNQILLTNPDSKKVEPFAFGINVIPCDFVSYDFTAKKMTREERRMIITGEIMGNTTGFLIDPKPGEEDNLYFVVLQNTNKCSFNGNKDNIIHLPGLRDIFNRSPFKNKGRIISGYDQSVTAKYEGLLRTVYIPEKNLPHSDPNWFNDGHPNYLLVSNGENTIKSTTLLFKTDSALASTTILGFAFQHFKTCDHYVVNMDYIDLSKYKNSSGGSRINQEILIFLERDEKLNYDPVSGNESTSNVIFGEGFQYIVMTPSVSPMNPGYFHLSKYFKFVGEMAPMPKGRHSDPFQSYNHILHGGMIGLNKAGELCYMFALVKYNVTAPRNYSKLDFNYYIYACPINTSKNSQERGFATIDFENNNREGKLVTEYSTTFKDLAGIFFDFMSDWCFPKGGPKMDIQPPGTLNGDVYFVAGREGPLTATRGDGFVVNKSTTKCGTASNTEASPEYKEEQKLIPVSFDAAKTKAMKDFLYQNGIIKIVFYGFPYIIDRNSPLIPLDERGGKPVYPGIPTISANFTNYKSQVKETAQGYSVDWEIGPVFGKKDLFELTATAMGDVSKMWGYKETNTTTESLQVSQPNSYDDYKDCSLLIYVKGSGCVSGVVSIRANDGGDPILLWKGSVEKERILFDTFYVQADPDKFVLESSTPNIVKPNLELTPEAAGLGTRDFGNLVFDDSDATWAKIQQWESDNRLQGYIDLSKIPGSGITINKSQGYGMNGSDKADFSVSTSSSKYSKASWSAGNHFKAVSKWPFIVGFMVEEKYKNKNEENFSDDNGHTNGFTFNYAAQAEVLQNRRFILYLLDIEISALKTYLASQDPNLKNPLPREKPFFVPQINWDCNQDFALLISKTSDFSK